MRVAPRGSRREALGKSAPSDRNLHAEKVATDLSIFESDAGRPASHSPRVGFE